MAEVSLGVTPAQRKWLPMLAAVGFFMQSLDGTILNTALPSMAETLGESPLQMQSVVIAYMLTVALLIPASGWLADRFGTRRIYLGGNLAVHPRFAGLCRLRFALDAGGCPGAAGDWRRAADAGRAIGGTAGL